MNQPNFEGRLMMSKARVVRKFIEVVELVKKGEYDYRYRPQYLDDLPEGPRVCASYGTPQSEVSDFILGGYHVKLNKDKCIKCGACWVYCPLGVIKETTDGYFEIDHDYCRPCGICAQECPEKAIEFKAK